ncbi:VOC family protein [Prosthecobacter dejongeii]|uniref:Putative enzyme related to lactoylglutathione lyase n=1 Tax=Prosthecobacter dejongeii TaxID=48465 RepID=A0A7W8DSG5_9BACT|nr:VOC family protein [Prosthecobacter dejongeii]MBB5039816.1 putative enzyme related to lactoylglutathione lyase [Prosthecobacter dejongeii]
MPKTYFCWRCKIPVPMLTEEAWTEVEGQEPTWVEYEIGPHTLAITIGGEMWKPSKDGGGVALEVEDFEESLKWLKQKGVEPYFGPYESPVCHMALISDPDGNSICIHKRKPGHH